MDLRPSVQCGRNIDTHKIDLAREKVAANNDLMKSLGYSATPTIVYKNDNGEVGVKQGLPQGNQVETILGGPKP
ncbi:MAG: hypothetical protein ACTHWH_03250 [Marinobacter sp.]